MTVWVLTQSYPYEGEALYGVYSSERLAEQAARDYRGPAVPGCEWCVYEVEVDASSRWYGWEDRLANVRG